MARQHIRIEQEVTENMGEINGVIFKSADGMTVDLTKVSDAERATLVTLANIVERQRRIRHDVEELRANQMPTPTMRLAWWLGFVIFIFLQQLFLYEFRQMLNITPWTASIIIILGSLLSGLLFGFGLGHWK